MPKIAPKRKTGLKFEVNRVSTQRLQTAWRGKERSPLLRDVGSMTPPASSAAFVSSLAGLQYALRENQNESRTSPCSGHAQMVPNSLGVISSTRKLRRVWRSTGRESEKSET